MSFLAALDRVLDHKPQPFIAPIRSDRVVSIFVAQGGVPYHLGIRDAEPGWWTMLPRRGGDCLLTGGVSAWAMFMYLEQLPRFYVIALYPVGPMTWLCVPFNAADAGQRGWPNSQPRQLYLVRHSLRPFDIVSARAMAGTLLYEDLDTSLRDMGPLGSTLREMASNEIPRPDVFRTAYELVRDRQIQLAKQRALEAIEERRSTERAHLEWQLDFIGAKLTDLTEVEGGYEVRWEYNGKNYAPVRLNKDMRVVSAGICLHNEADYNLSGILPVLERTIGGRQHDYGW